MPRGNNGKQTVKCSFCGKTQENVKRIVAGPGVYICDECIKVCGNILEDEYYEDELEEEIKKYYPTSFSLIHGDCTFSNLMFDTFDMKAILIDPRGYFGKTIPYL